MSTRSPTIAAVIPCYNVAPYVEECIRSVLAQTAPFDEIIIVDDGSVDGTADLLQRHASHPHVVVHRLEQNRGLGPARNHGVALARSDYVCFVDADDVVSADLVASFGAAARDEPALDLFCYSGINVRDGQAATHDGFLYSGAFSGTGVEAFCRLVLDGTFASCPVLYVFRRSILDWRAAGFRNMLHEDEELTPRLFLAARRVVVQPAVLYRRRLRAGSLTAAPTSLASVTGCAISLLTLLRLYVSHLRNGALRAALGRRIVYLARIVAGQTRRLLLTPLANRRGAARA